MDEKKFFSNLKGFTLIELLFAIVIISILASLAIIQYKQYKINAISGQLLSDLRNCMNDIANSKQTGNSDINLVVNNCKMSPNTQSIEVLVANPIKLKATSQIGPIECEYYEATGRVTCNNSF